MLTSKVQRFLDELFVQYTLHTNVKTESTLQFAAYAKSIGAHAIKTVLFSDKRGPLLVAFDAKDGLDFDTLFRVTGRELGLDSGHKYKHNLHGYSIRHLPPFGRYFQIPMVYDANLQYHKRYLIEISNGDNFIEVDQKGFNILFAHASVKSFTRKVPVKSSTSYSQLVERNSQRVTNKPQKSISPLLSVKAVEKQFAEGVNLPVMPFVSKKLLSMRAQDSIDIDKLIYVLSIDPVISGKIMAYANSPFFAFQGKLETLQDAIFRVLGVDLTINTALALSLGQEFKGPEEGPYGAKNVWRHAVYSAVLTQSIATSVSRRFPVNPDAAYLYALLHNIGFLTLGHLYSKRFSLFNTAVSRKKKIPLHIIEEKVLGISHVKVGELLVKAWGLPKVYEAVIANHHNAQYEGEFEIYVHLIYLANSLLKSLEIGDEKDAGIPESLLQRYQISDNEIQTMLEIVMSWNENLDHLASQLAA